MNPTHFDPEFFPTPMLLAWKMFEPYRKLIEDGEINSVLDPEAGKGDLLKPVLAMRDRPRIYAIEKSLELRGALSLVGLDENRYDRSGRDLARAIHVLGDDVFAYEGRHAFDLILMNPPFSRGAEHLLRAWELIAYGGRIACLLNAETVKNPYTSRRQQIVQLINAHGTQEDVGLAFSHAEVERRTDVSVVLVRLQKPAVKSERFSFSRAQRESNAPRPISSDVVENAIARQDFVGNAAIAFDLASRALCELSQAWSKADHYLSAAGVSLESLLPIDHRADAKPERVNDLIDAAQAAAWRSIIQRSEVEKYFTERMRKDFDTEMSSRMRLDFNRTNILALFETIFLSRESIIDAAVTDVFDKMCSYAPENKVPYETWKTNSGHRVNLKVILPRFVVWESYCGFRLTYQRDTTDLDDIDKALCHITGRPYDSIQTIQKALKETFTRLQDRTIESVSHTATSEFFEMRFYKKGTLHLKFRDRKVWEMFNIAAAKGKGWLGAQDVKAA